MGHCGFRYIDNTEEIEIIYLLDPKYWDQGITTKTGKTALQYAFTIPNVDKVIARVRIDNSKSKNVIDKLGFKFIGYKNYNGRTAVILRVRKTRK